MTSVKYCPLVGRGGRCSRKNMNDGNSCMCLLKQKIQTELSGHEEALEEIKKKNEEKDPSHRIMGQIDLTQVHTHTHAHTHVEIHT